MARILVVDDNTLLRTILRDVLEKAGHTVDEAEDGTVALAKLKARLPDLVVTDYYMPNMTGAELTTVIRRDVSLKTLPVIGLAGTNDSRQQLETAGVDEYLPKPMKEKQLVGAVQKILERTGAKEE